MNKFLVLIAFLLTTIVNAQETTGSIAGKLTDREMNGEALPFANVTIKGTSKGTTSDYDGLYVLDKLEPGTYTVVFSFIGYETLEIPNVQVVAGKVTEINTDLGSSAAALEEVVITTVSRRDSEVALLLEQKGAIDIKESIGSQELAKLGVSDAATATTKISGVTSSQASGDIYVRGLGDRYLYTTMNGLPIPSDDIERKNIDLELFPTRIVQSIGISKTYSPRYSADQASGNVDISSRALTGTEEFSAGVRAGVNTNVLKDGVFDNFKSSPNMNDVDFGFYTRSMSTQEAVANQSWNTQTTDLPINYRYQLNAGKKFGEKFKVLFSGSQSREFQYQTGVFKEFLQNNRENEFTDATTYQQTYNTTALVDLGYEFNDNNNVRALSLFIDKTSDIVYEAGRNGEGFTQDETNPNEGYSQFIRDQNIKNTQLWVNQIFGEHKLSEKNEFTWGVGANLVNADEPNRIRNEVNFREDGVILGRTGGLQQRKTNQQLEDQEINARLNDELKIFEKEDTTSLTINVGGNFRNKQRDFASVFIGLDENNPNNPLTAQSIDNLGEVLNADNIRNSRLRVTGDDVDAFEYDRYKADLTSAAGYVTANYSIDKFNINVGARYQRDELEVDYDVKNINPNRGTSSKAYDNIYPSLNVRYAVNDNSNIRIAASKTITLPEFKEISPFEYVNPRGQATRGNVDLEASTAYNFDLKYEFFPSSSELLSVTGFYKQIEDPIQKALTTGSSGVFSYFNTSDKAEVYGVEFDADINVFDLEKSGELDFNVNVTRMWHEQDLRDVYNEDGDLVRTFKYSDKTTSELQGASDWIFNAALNYTTDWEKKLSANLSANYASDKIFSLGSSTNARDYQNFYSDEIIEKGFVSMNAVLTQQLSDNWVLRFTGKNLLNPDIERTQNIRPVNNEERTETVNSYNLGVTLNLGVSFTF